MITTPVADWKLIAGTVLFSAASCNRWGCLLTTAAGSGFYHRPLRPSGPRHRLGSATRPGPTPVQAPRRWSLTTQRHEEFTIGYAIWRRSVLVLGLYLVLITEPVALFVFAGQFVRSPSLATVFSSSRPGTASGAAAGRRALRRSGLGRHRLSTCRAAHLAYAAIIFSLETVFAAIAATFVVTSGRTGRGQAATDALLPDPPVGGGSPAANKVPSQPGYLQVIVPQRGALGRLAG